jgi:23S rRNA pseudouridine955/2504/2580 synthase
MIEIKITSNDQNKRLDKFVKKYLSKAPDSFIYKLFRKKDVKVNKKPKNIDYITQVDDVITIYITKEQEESFIEKKEIDVSNKQDFSVIYEDENILVVNKPANLLVHDGDDKLKNDDTLTKQVLNYLISTNAYDPSKENIFIPALAHRIDRNTSGLVVFGKTSIALQELFKAFKNHDGMDKEYETLVCGKVTEKGKIEAKLIKNEKTKIVNVDETNGLKALTLYTPIKVYEDVSLLSVKILTGRTHQIRVHLKHINHPLVGDQKYGNRNSDMLAKKYQMSGYFLHAKKLCFHNLENELSYLNNKEFVAPLFDWEVKLINKLNKGE